jgi:hypothetical protein
LNQISGITQEEEKERNEGIDSVLLADNSPVNAAPVKSQKTNNSSKQMKEMEANIQNLMFGTQKTVGAKIQNFDPSNDLFKPAGESQQKIGGGSLFGD